MHTVGKNLSSIRKLRGLTLEGLADRVKSEAGVNMSPSQLGRYERNERSVSVNDLIILAIALDCNVQTLLDGIDPRMGELAETKREVSRLSPEDHRILRYIATDWGGDIHALMIADGCYAALPSDYAVRAMMALMGEVASALANGEMDASSLPPGLPYLEERIGNLINGKGRK